MASLRYSEKHYWGSSMRGQDSYLVGERFDKLIVIDIVEKTKSGKLWLCRCDCGNTTIKLTTQLTRLRKNNGRTGCKQCEKKSRSDSCCLTTHGLCKLGQSRLYRTWKGMRSRCQSKSATSYPWYGEKGIKVCDEWQSFPVFREWALKNGYNDNFLDRKNMLTIDRINPFGNYEPSNCRWITASDNSKGPKRKNRIEEYVKGDANA